MTKLKLYRLINTFILFATISTTSHANEEAKYIGDSDLHDACLIAVESTINCDSKKSSTPGDAVWDEETYHTCYLNIEFRKKESDLIEQGKFKVYSFRSNTMKEDLLTVGLFFTGGFAFLSTINPGASTNSIQKNLNYNLLQLSKVSTCEGASINLQSINLP